MGRLHNGVRNRIHLERYDKSSRRRKTFMSKFSTQCFIWPSPSPPPNEVSGNSTLSSAQ